LTAVFNGKLEQCHFRFRLPAQKHAEHGTERKSPKWPEAGIRNTETEIPHIPDRGALGKQLPINRSMGADPKAPKVLLAVNISPNEGRYYGCCCTNGGESIQMIGYISSNVFGVNLTLFLYILLVYMVFLVSI
uniref:Uncharacterized protein n=1 Tax=Heligmosomoides polygyrus TaxID=6339 RepID=A0A183F2S7_HELPZ